MPGEAKDVLPLLSPLDLDICTSSSRTLIGSSRTIQQTLTAWQNFDADGMSKKFWQQSLDAEWQRLVDIEPVIPTDSRLFCDYVADYARQAEVQKEIEINIKYFNDLQLTRYPSKGDVRAELLRGDDLATYRQWLPALHLYTIAVLRASFDSGTLADAYQRRAEAYLELDRPDHALEDIQIAFQYRTWSDPNVLVILVKALARTGRLRKAKIVLRDLSGRLPKEGNECAKLIDSLEALSMGPDLVDSDSDGDSDSECGMSHKKLCIEETPKPYTRYLTSSHELECCHYCFVYLRPPPLPESGATSSLRLRKYHNLHSCRHCLAVLYCSEACRNASWEAHHRHECRFFPLIAHCEPMSQLHLALRVLVNTPLPVVIEYARQMNNPNYQPNDFRGTKYEAIAADYGRIASIEYDHTIFIEPRYHFPFVFGSVVFIEVLKRTDYIHEGREMLEGLGEEELCRLLGGTIYRLMHQVHNKGKWQDVRKEDEKEGEGKEKPDVKAAGLFFYTMPV